MTLTQVSNTSPIPSSPSSLLISLIYWPLLISLIHWCPEVQEIFHLYILTHIHYFAFDISALIVHVFFIIHLYNIAFSTGLSKLTYWFYLYSSYCCPSECSNALIWLRHFSILQHLMTYCLFQNESLII